MRCGFGWSTAAPGWRAATYSVLVDRAIGPRGAGRPDPRRQPAAGATALIWDPHGRAAPGRCRPWRRVGGGAGGSLCSGGCPGAWLSGLVADAAPPRLRRDRQARALFGGAAGPSGRRAVAVDPCAGGRDRMGRGARSRPRSAFRRLLLLRAADHADHDAADLDRRLGRARGRHDGGVRLCRTCPADGLVVSLLFGIILMAVGAIGGGLVWVLSGEKCRARRRPTEPATGLGGRGSGRGGGGGGGGGRRRRIGEGGGGGAGRRWSTRKDRGPGAARLGRGGRQSTAARARGGGGDGTPPGERARRGERGIEG